MYEQNIKKAARLATTFKTDTVSVALPVLYFLSLSNLEMCLNWFMFGKKRKLLLHYPPHTTMWLFLFKLPLSLALETHTVMFRLGSSSPWNSKVALSCLALSPPPSGFPGHCSNFLTHAESHSSSLTHFPKLLSKLLHHVNSQSLLLLFAEVAISCLAEVCDLRFLFSFCFWREET